MKKTIGYLGPEGSYSHEVAKHVGVGCELMALEPSRFIHVLHDKSIHRAVLPVVNAIGWQVPWVLDLLMANNGDYGITREIIWNIRSHLIGFGSIDDVKTVCSHAQPLEQCKEFLGRIPNITTQGMASTSAAVKFVAGKKDPSWAAIGTGDAAKMYGVPIIAREISDRRNNQTRFIVLGGKKSGLTGKDKTSLLFGTANKPGALLRVLEIFDSLDINMTDLFSTASPGKKLGECFFLVDVEAHKNDRKMAVALEQINTRVEYLKVLGSYPKAICAANAN